MHFEGNKANDMTMNLCIHCCRFAFQVHRKVRGKIENTNDAIEINFGVFQVEHFTLIFRSLCVVLN